MGFSAMCVLFVIYGHHTDTVYTYSMRTLGDLLERFQLYAVCTDCERMEQVRVQALIERFGAALPIDTVRQRLRCRGCRQRTGDIRIVYVGEQGKVAGFHYRGADRGARPAIAPQHPAARQPVSSSVDSSVRPKPSTPT